MYGILYLLVRIAVTHFCRHKLYPKKHSLIERLKRTIKEKNEENGGSGPSKSKHKLEKPMRSVGIGWLYADSPESSLKQVRINFGGGTHMRSLQRKLSIKEIQEIAEEIFYPGGKGPKQKGYPLKSDYNLDVRDFHHNVLDGTKKLSDFVIEEPTSRSKLRIYLASIKRQKDIDIKVNSTKTTETINSATKYIFSSSESEDEATPHSIHASSVDHPISVDIVLPNNEVENESYFNIENITDEIVSLQIIPIP